MASSPSVQSSALHWHCPAKDRPSVPLPEIECRPAVHSPAQQDHPPAVGQHCECKHYVASNGYGNPEQHLRSGAGNAMASTVGTCEGAKSTRGQEKYLACKSRGAGAAAAPMRAPHAHAHAGAGWLTGSLYLPDLPVQAEKRTTKMSPATSYLHGVRHGPAVSGQSRGPEPSCSSGAAEASGPAGCWLLRKQRNFQLGRGRRSQAHPAHPRAGNQPSTALPRALSRAGGQCPTDKEGPGDSHSKGHAVDVLGPAHEVVERLRSTPATLLVRGRNRERGEASRMHLYIASSLQAAL